MSGVQRLCRRLSVVGVALVALALAGAIVSPPALASPTTWYVGGAGCSDTGPGTPAQPYCTINKAAAVATAGQTVLVSSGTYPEKVTVKNSGTAGSPIVFQPASGATVVVTGAADGFVLSARQYVTISGFSVTATSSYGISVSDSSNIVLSGNTVTSVGHPVSGQIAPGIRLSNTSASTVSGNVADHNSDSGIFLTNGSTGNVVSSNEASWNANGYQRNANGINVISPGNTITGNVLHDNEDSGLQFYTGGNNNLAVDNVSYNNGDHGIDDFNVTGGRLIGNTIYHNCTTGINIEGTSGSYLVKNNVVVDNAVYPAYNGIACNRRAGNIGVWDSAPPTTTVDHNLVWLTTGGTMYVFGTSFTSLVAMRTATGQEQHGLQADPRFVAAASGDLRLSAGSPAIDSADSGASGAPATDQLGAARVDDPSIADAGAGPRSYDDRGAYEFQPDGGGGGGTPLPPTAALTVSPSGGVAPVAVTADASGSTDPQQGPLTYAFSFGDGGTAGPQSQPTATHTYAVAGTYTATVTVTNSATLTATATAPVTVQAGGGGGGSGPAGYVSQIASNFSTNTHTSGSLTVWRTQGVQAGDLMVVTLQLTGTSAGAVTGTDDAGDPLTVAADAADGSGNRLVVLSGVAATGLATNQKITVTFPSATTYRLTGDEASGVIAADRQATASGTATTYASGPTAATTDPDELVFGAVGLVGGTAPAWASGWTALSTYSVGTNYLGRAYQTTTAPGQFNATGSGTGGWLAVCATFH